MRRIAPAIVVVALALGGCSYVADVPLIGVPANAPPRPEGSGTYLPVHDIPPQREEQVLSVPEQTRIYDELDKARTKGKANAAADAAEIAASQPPPKPAGKTPPKKKAEKEAR